MLHRNLYGILPTVSKQKVRGPYRSNRLTFPTNDPFAVTPAKLNKWNKKQINTNLHFLPPLSFCV
jgi:hypothetical protein